MYIYMHGYFFIKMINVVQILCFVVKDDFILNYQGLLH